MLELYKKTSFENLKNRNHAQLEYVDELKCNDILSEFITKFKAKHLS